MSTHAFFALPKTRRRVHEGPLGAHIDAFATRLLEQGFSPGESSRQDSTHCGLKRLAPST
jgi:hypothetical protein